MVKCTSMKTDCFLKRLRYNFEFIIKVWKISYQVHLNFLAWSQTSCKSGSYWTTIVFSMKEPCGVGPEKGQTN